MQPDLTCKKCIFLKSYTVFPLSESHNHEVSSDEAAEHKKYIFEAQDE